jgi:carboxypeptidase family protein
MSFRKAVTLLALTTLSAACGGGGSTEQAAPPSTVAAAPGAPAAGATGNGNITGKVGFQGTPPAPEKVKVAADPKCQSMHPQGLEKQTVQVKDGGLAHVFVWVKNAPAASTPPTEPVLLDQQGCMYHPHVVGVQTGQPFKIRNSDETLHNIHPRPTINQEFNIGQPRKGMESVKTFDKQEIMIPVGCDVHPWMRSYISVVGHPYFAVTKDDGTYEIKGLPAGEYEVEAYHEKLKTQTQKVTVKDGDNKLDFSYQGS